MANIQNFSEPTLLEEKDKQEQAEKSLQSMRQQSEQVDLEARQLANEKLKVEIEKTRSDINRDTNKNITEKAKVESDILKEDKTMESQQMDKERDKSILDDPRNTYDPIEQSILYDPDAEMQKNKIYNPNERASRYMTNEQVQSLEPKLSPVLTEEEDIRTQGKKRLMGENLTQQTQSSGDGGVGNVGGLLDISDKAFKEPVELQPLESIPQQDFESRKETFEELKKFNQGVKDRNDAVNKIKEYQKEQFDFVQNRYKDLIQKQRNLINDVPTYNSVIRRIPAITKILSVISAGLSAAAGFQNPTWAIDDIIKQEFQSQKLAYDAKSKSLTQEESLLSNIYKITQDKVKAELLFESTLTQNTINGLNVLIKASGIESEIQKAKQLKVNLENKDKMAQNKIKNSLINESNKITQQKINNDFKKFELLTKEREKKQQFSSFGIPMKTESSMKKFDEKINTHTEGVLAARKLNNLLMKIDLSGLSEEKVKEKFKSMTKEQKNIAVAVQNMQGDGKLTRGGKRFWIWLKDVRGVTEDSENQAVNAIFRELTKIATANRINYTGGGNMSGGEIKLLFMAVGLSPPSGNEFDPNQIKGGIRRSIADRTLNQGIMDVIAAQKQAGINLIRTHSSNNYSRTQASREFSKLIASDEKRLKMDQEDERDRIALEQQRGV